MTGTLSKADVDRLRSDPSDGARADVARKLARQIDDDRLTPPQRQLAADILRALSRDAALSVRQTLAAELKQSRHLPHDVALILARDVAAVSEPVLSQSPVLTDADLVAVIRAGGADKQAAIAARKQVSSAVAEAIIDSGQAAAVAVLVGNDGAEIGEGALHRVLDRHGANDRVKSALARRTRLPAALHRRMAASQAAAGDRVPDARPRATAEPLSPASRESEALARAQQLHTRGELTPPLIVRAICLGDLAFVEAAFSVLGDIPLHNARLLIYDAGLLGFKAIYERCKLPLKFLDLFRIGLRVAQQTPFDGGDNDRERHSRRTLERILTQYENIGPDDLEYLLGKLRSGSGAAA